MSTIISCFFVKSAEIFKEKAPGYPGADLFGYCAQFRKVLQVNSESQ